MAFPDNDDPLLDALLAGTPVRVIDAVVADGGLPVRAMIDALREDLAAIPLALPYEPVTEGFRERLVSAIAALPERPRRRAAVLVVDMLVDHLTPGSPMEVPRARAIVPAVQSRLARARASHEPVVYLCDHHEADDPELETWPLHNTRTPREDIWPTLAPEPDDVLVTHRSYSGFFESRLDDTLRSLDVNTLVLTGCLSEFQIFATATDALERGYTVELPDDCHAGSSVSSERQVRATLSMMRPTEPLRVM